MVLNNFWSLMAGLGNTIAYNSGLQPTDIYLVDTSGEVRRIMFCNSTSTGSTTNYIHDANAYWWNLKAFVGSGTRTPTTDDYCLVDDITSSFNFFSLSYEAECRDGSCILVATISGANNTGSTLTVSEVGLGKNLCWGTRVSETSWNTGNFDALYVREVLDNPIIVPPARGFTLTLEWVQS